MKAFCADKRNKFYRKPMKARLERVLRLHGINYAAYHGGDLVGNDCRKLMRHAEQICKDLECVLLTAADEKRMLESCKIAISDCCDAFHFALVCFDSVFSLMFKANEEVVMEVDLPELQKLVDLAVVAWQELKKTNMDGFKNIPPKLHGLVQHLTTQFEKYGGIGDFDEQFVERSHQSGKDDMFRSRAIRRRNKKFQCFARWEGVRSHPGVMAVSEGVNKNRKRKRNGGVEAPERKKLARVARATARATIISNHVHKNLKSAGELTLEHLELMDAALGETNAVANDGVDDNDNDDIAPIVSPT